MEKLIRDSFVIHSNYIEDLPESLKLSWLGNIYDYAIKGIEPVLKEELEQTIWTSIKRRIDKECFDYEEKKLRAKINSIKYRLKNNTATEADLDFLNKNKDSEIVRSIRIIRTDSTYTNTPGVSVYDNVNVNVNDNVNDNVSEFKSVYVYANDNVNVNDININNLSESQKSYGYIIFDNYSKAGFPCCSNNLVSFLSKDFKSALEHLKGYSSNDVIEATRNYIKVIKDRNTWVKSPLPFPNFVTSKLFTRCLPYNFHLEDFLVANAEDDIAKEIKKQKEKEEFDSIFQ